MIYFAQDVGEPGDGDAGFGDPTRTTIFDYWGVPSHQRWMNGGKFDGGALREGEKDLRDFYERVLNFSATNPAMQGEYAEIQSANREAIDGYDGRLFAFVRWQGDERLIVVSNFDSDRSYELFMTLPPDVVSAWQLEPGRYVLDEQLYGENNDHLVVNEGTGTFGIRLGPLESVVYRVGRRDMVRYNGFESEYVDARNVDVWLPHGYDASDDRYSVLYMHDGQNLFIPFQSIYNGADWGVDESLQQLIDDGRARKTIVVGIWNTPKRRLEYLPQEAWDSAPQRMRAYIENTEAGTPQSREYLRFIVEELKPFIDRNYRTRPGREDTFIMGSSMGGLISLYAMIRHPDVFSAAACVSTHWPLHVDLNEIDATTRFIRFLEPAMPAPDDARFYFDFGTEELDGLYEPHQQLIDAMMRRLGYTEGKNWVTLKFEGAGHSEVAWNERVHIPLEFLLRPAP
jgi:predicted alpha/beta superfamily hydrolase